MAERSPDAGADRAESTQTPAVPEIAGTAWENWRLGGEPPVQINPNAQTHELIAWCWGEARHIANIVAVFSTSRHGDHDATTVADLLDARAQALTAMLHRLASNSAKEALFGQG